MKAAAVVLLLLWNDFIRACSSFPLFPQAMWIVKEDFSAERQHCTVGKGMENASFDELLC